MNQKEYTQSTTLSTREQAMTWWRSLKASKQAHYAGLIGRWSYSLTGREIEQIWNSDQLLKESTKQMFPNGFKSWQETHFEVVSTITKEANKAMPRGAVKETIETQGTGGLYELAENLTNEFENLNKGRKWDGEFFEEIEEFCHKKLFESV